MDWVIWIIIISAFILSFVGLIYPIIPGVLLIWAGGLVFHFFIDSEVLTWWTWGSFLFFTILLFGIDILASFLFVKRSGGSVWGVRAATIGIVIGCFVIPPFGILLVPFIIVLLVELVQKKTFNESAKIAIGTILAFFSSTFAKGFIQLIMIGIFLINVFLK
ncbi:DUF456 family protein [Evansella sp. AB-P1]|uniref:DUF456 domain-containing protein n=1 Tax=Evansella sp. AB-P1 TaxID=3037653 RepID=UPI00241CF4AC|nr:DUF456 family protein [Evansella sp. AB-P1]MDG5789535.1 DUF456 family protein [Evansella sp. AB-P1]